VEDYREATDLVESLKMKEGKQLWPNEDISMRKVELASSKELIRLAERVVKVFERSKASLAEEWATEALTWAISCPSHHLVNRSYQMYRYVISTQPSSPPRLWLIGCICHGRCQSVAPLRSRVEDHANRHAGVHVGTHPRPHLGEPLRLL